MQPLRDEHIGSPHGWPNIVTHMTEGVIELQATMATKIGRRGSRELFI